MASSALITHCGARRVEREALDKIDAPPPTETWFPLKHSTVVETVSQALTAGGFVIERAEYALSRDDARMFSSMNLSASVASGVNLAVGIRNSLDKSYPLGFCAGSRVFVCDNLAFRSELLVRRKHTRFGEVRFQEAICRAVQSLQQFRQIEADRIRTYQSTDLSEDAAALYLLQAFERNLLNHVLLKKAIHEWRCPSHEEFQPRTKWSLLNACTTVLTARAKSNPQQFARTTMQLQDLLDGPKLLPALPITVDAVTSNP